VDAIQEFSSAQELSEYFYELQGKIKPNVTIEVGAYDAAFSRSIVANYPEIVSWAFEANRYNYKNYSLEALADGVKYVYSAISSEVGEIPFYYQNEAPNTVGNNSILERLKTSQYKEIVPATTLDTFFIESGLLNKDDSVSLWIDVEGASREVLMKSELILKQTKSILIEVEHDEVWSSQWKSQDVVEFLTSRGFTLTGRDKEYYPLQENFLFIKDIV
jgi:FkbM family methyltransferase